MSCFSIGVKLAKATMLGVFDLRRGVFPGDIKMQGRACFSKISDDAYEYREMGEYEKPEDNQKFFQNQTYVWGESMLRILRVDKSVLHEFSFGEDESYPLLLWHTHQCKNDIYKIKLNIISENEFTTEYVVLGPKKDYQVNSRFLRIGYGRENF